jgi:hypothetical protein
VVANLTHRWRERLFATFAVGFEYADYLATDDSQNASRVDHYVFFRPSLNYAISDSSSLSIFYQYSYNDSDGFGANSFERGNYGVMLNYVF